MSVARPILGLVSLVLLAGAIVLQFFIVLSGAITTLPEYLVYFLQASTNGVPGAVANPARWTYFAICGVDADGRNANCGPNQAALPFSPEMNFGTTEGLSMEFIGTNYYYYLSRFSWAFFIIALVFSVIAFLTSALALCTRLGALITGSSTFVALFFQALAASLMTAWTVKGRNAFQANGQDANLGTYAYAFSWTPVACLFLCTVFYFIGGSIGGNRDKHAKKSFFSRKRSTRSRGSFIDNESGRRVKDEYE